MMKMHTIRSANTITNTVPPTLITAKANIANSIKTVTKIANNIIDDTSFS